MKISNYSTLTFDCYGTLIDWESGIIEGLKPLLDQLPQQPDKNTILQTHAYHESTQQRWTPGCRYSDLLTIVYKRLAEEWKVSVTPEACRLYGESVKNWPAFPDSAPALNYLKKHYKLVILSNVDNASFAASNNKLQVEFDAIFTAEDVGSYKPDDRNFDYMLEQLERLGVGRHEILHTAESMFHDHVPAKRHHLASCWIYRRHEQQGYGATMNPGDQPDVEFTFNSMAELVKAHQQETGSTPGNS